MNQIAQNISSPINTKDNSNKFGLGILFLFMSTGNIYLFPSGLPQVSHYFLFWGIIFIFLSRFMRNTLHFDKAGITAIAFGLLTFSINMIHFTFLPDKVFLLSSFYYIYNALIFVFISILFRESPRQTLKIIYWGVLVSCLIEIIVILFFSTLAGGRELGTFNNPNQLSYWAIFSACILVLLRSYVQIRWYDLCILLAFFWMQTLALSKAGLITFSILLLFIPLFRVVPGSYKLFITFIFGLFIILALSNLSYISETVQKYQNVHNSFQRLQNIGHEVDDNPRNRGYYRPIEYPHHLFLGAGEGGYARFNDMPWPLEIHSGLISILFCYGVLGFSVFALFLYQIVLRAPPVFLLVLFLILLNGVTHQNIRFSYFWITMAVAYNVYLTRERKIPPPAIYSQTNNKAQ